MSIAGMGAPIAAAINVAGNAIQSNQDYKRNLGMMREAADVQLKNQRIMGYFNKEQQLDMWNKTNYEAQRKHMEKAGLNVGLMYGMGGGGGATAAAASGNASAVSGSHKSNPLDIAGAMVSGAQVENMIAQNELIKAQTVKTEAEAEKISGVDTEKTKAETVDLTQGVENKKAQEALTKAQAYVAEMSKDEQVWQIEANLDKAVQEVFQAQNETHISNATVKDKIQIIRQEAIGAMLENELRKGNIEINQQQITKLKTEITNMVQQNMLNWDKMSLEERRLQIEKQFRAEGLDLEKTRSLMNSITNIFR